jgi:hypothetical protein
VSDQSVRRYYANLKQCAIVRGLDIIELFDDLEDLVEAEIEELIGLSLKIVIANKDSIVGVNIRCVIGKSILKLS